MPQLLDRKKVSLNKPVRVHFDSGCSSKEDSKPGSCGYYVLVPDRTLIYDWGLYLSTGNNINIVES